MNLIITCQRNLEDPTILEAQNMLERFGDVDAIIEKTVFSGIIQAQTSLDNIKVLEDFRETAPRLYLRGNRTCRGKKDKVQLDLQLEIMRCSFSKRKVQF